MNLGIESKALIGNVDSDCDCEYENDNKLIVFDG